MILSSFTKGPGHVFANAPPSRTSDPPASLRALRPRSPRGAGRIPRTARLAGAQRGRPALRADAAEPLTMAVPVSRERIFHPGEVALQTEAGVAERMARVGPQAIRDHMPEQHRQFFALLPFVVVGSIDAQGQPAASL